MITPKSKFKEFRLASWSINNSNTIYVVILIFLFLGVYSYTSLPREDFPEINESKIYISAVYPGNTAEDIENLIVDPLEDKLKGLNNILKISSNSEENFGLITVEFDDRIDLSEAKQKVQDIVNTEKSKDDWPVFNETKIEPNVFEFSISEEVPILNINLKGDYQISQLKEYAELLKEEIENLNEIKQVDIRGAQDKEVVVEVDIYKMMSAKVSFDDILNAIKRGNITQSAGRIITSNQQKNIRILGEIRSPYELENFVVKYNEGIVYLRDVANINFQDKDKNTFARDFGDNVVMLDIKKRSGKNMISAVARIYDVIDKIKKDRLPRGLIISLANDQSARTLNQVNDLVNNIIFGVILVVTVLMFFLGLRNALFVGFAIPMSMFISFAILSALGYTLNTMILFALIMGLGMLVDNAIVVVENVYRIMEEEGLSSLEAAKKGVGEIAFPIIISTATTVAAFVPLGMWPGIMGEFMIYFPITLSIVLGSSLFVAIFINSMLVSVFMKTDIKSTRSKKAFTPFLIISILGILVFIFGRELKGFGMVMISTSIFGLLHISFLDRFTKIFRKKFLSFLENYYELFLSKALKGKTPYLLTTGVFVLLISVIFIFGASLKNQRTKVEFFPDNEPNQITVYIEYPEGTDIKKTNAITKAIEQNIFSTINDKEYLDKEGENFLIESAISQVGKGAGNPQTDIGNDSEMPHKARITISLREYKYRKGKKSENLRVKLQNSLKNIYPGVTISVEKDIIGPPIGYPINIELEGEDYEEVINTTDKIRNFLNSRNIAGIDELKINVNKKKPIIEVSVNREKAGELGIPIGMIGQQMRRSVFGEKASVYKQEDNDYDVVIRFDKESRYNLNAILNQPITFRDQLTGVIKEIPISSLVKKETKSGFSAIKRKNTSRNVILYSSLEPGYTDASAIISTVQEEMKSFDNIPNDIKINYTGKIEEQNKQMTFLVNAFFGGLALIFLILIFQFNSVFKPLIIMIAVLLSFIGVFGGIVLSGAPFVIIMTMMGIISLAGIVVNNGVVLLDYLELLIADRKKELGFDKSGLLSHGEITKLIIKSGKARLRPVLLTAITTILGLIPLAIGLNINFFSFFTDLNPNIYVGGDNVIFWGPLALTVIYGLIIATFLTLILVPCLFLIYYKIKIRRALLSS